MSSFLEKLIGGIKYDAAFLKGHTLQPAWYKIFKIFIVIGFLALYWIIFGFTKTIIFFACFVLMALAMHMTYRIKTHRYTRSWLDFIVYEEDGVRKYRRISWRYYATVILLALVAVTISQLLG
jgi:hypothetical protein